MERRMPILQLVYIPGRCSKVNKRLQVFHGRGPLDDVVETIENTPGHKYADSEKGRKFDDRFKGDGGYESFVAFGDIQVAGCRKGWRRQPG
jgi:hypothetical protein